MIKSKVKKRVLFLIYNLSQQVILSNQIAVFIAVSDGNLLGSLRLFLCMLGNAQMMKVLKMGFWD